MEAARGAEFQQCTDLPKAQCLEKNSRKAKGMGRVSCVFARDKKLGIGIGAKSEGLVIASSHLLLFLN